MSRNLKIALWSVAAVSLLIGAITVRSRLTPAPDTGRNVFAACGIPAAPIDPPVGASASQAQMVAAHSAVKAYDANTTSYLQCLDSTAARLEAQFPSGSADAGLRKVRALHVQLHNAAIDKDQSAADRFNIQLRVFKARNGP